MIKDVLKAAILPLVTALVRPLKEDGLEVPRGQVSEQGVFTAKDMINIAISHSVCKFWWGQQQLPGSPPASSYLHMW